MFLNFCGNPVKSVSKLFAKVISSIGVAPVMQYMHARNRNSNTQGSSPNVVKVVFYTLKNCSLRKEFAPSGSKFFPLRELPIMKRDVDRSGSVVECLTPDQRAGGWSLTGVTALWSLSKTHLS